MVYSEGRSMGKKFFLSALLLIVFIDRYIIEICTNEYKILRMTWADDMAMIPENMLNYMMLLKDGNRKQEGMFKDEFQENWHHEFKHE